MQLVLPTNFCTLSAKELSKVRSLCLLSAHRYGAQIDSNRRWGYLFMFGKLFASAMADTNLSNSGIIISSSTTSNGICILQSSRQHGRNYKFKSDAILVMLSISFNWLTGWASIRSTLYTASQSLKKRAGIHTHRRWLPNRNAKSF